MFGWVFTYHVLFVAIVFCAILAATKGGLPERIGGIANLASAVAVVLALRYVQPAQFPTAALCVDGLLAVTFLALTLRFATWWLGAAMLLQAVQFSLHAYYYVSGRPHDLAFAVVNNVVSWGVVFSILTGVFAFWLQPRTSAYRLGTSPRREGHQGHA